MSDSLLTDPMLADVPAVHGYRVLDPAVLVRKVAEGGMAAVYLGVHLRLRVPVAVKVLKPFQGDATARATERFGMEAEQAARLGHPNIVRVFDFRSGIAGPGGGPPYLVMEYIDGETVETRTRRKQRLSPREAATIALLTARGLKAAHREHIVHRDIKPANVLVSRAGDVKLTDLGIAKAGALHTMATGMTQENTILGTPQYMAPELWRGARHASFASDIYALGATLAFTLIGEHALGSGDLAEIMHRAVLEGFPDLRNRVRGLDATLNEIIRKATAQDAARRPSAGELETALQSYLAGVGGEMALDDAAAGGMSPDGLPSQAILTAIRKSVDAAERPRAYNPATIPPETLDALTRSAPIPVAAPNAEPAAPKPKAAPAPVRPSRPPVVEARVPMNPLRPAGKRKRRGGRVLLLLALAGLAGVGYVGYQNGWASQVGSWWRTLAVHAPADPPTTQPATRPATVPIALATRPVPPTPPPATTQAIVQTPATKPTTTVAIVPPATTRAVIPPPATRPTTVPATVPVTPQPVLANAYQQARDKLQAQVKAGKWAGVLQDLEPMFLLAATTKPDASPDAAAVATDALLQFRDANSDPASRRQAFPQLKGVLAMLQKRALPIVDLLEFERHITEALGGVMRLAPVDGTMADARAALERSLKDAPPGPVRAAAAQRARQLFRMDAMVLAHDNKPDLLLALLEGGARRPEWQGSEAALQTLCDEALVAARPADGVLGAPFISPNAGVERLNALATAGVVTARVAIADQWLRRKPVADVFPVLDAGDDQRIATARKWFAEAAEHADPRTRIRAISRLGEIAAQSNESADHAAAYAYFTRAVKLCEEQKLVDPIAYTGRAGYLALAADDPNRRVLADKAFEDLRKMRIGERAIEAVRAARRAADTGDVQARYNLSTLLAALVRQNLFDNADLPAIDAEVRENFRAALDGGHPAAADALARWDRK